MDAIVTAAQGIKQTHLSGTVEAWRYSPPVGWLLSTAQGVLFPAAVLSFVLLFYLFPDGRFVPRWMTWPVGAVVVLTIGFWLYLLLQPDSQPGLSIVEDWGWQIWLYALLACIAIPTGEDEVSVTMVWETAGQRGDWAAEIMMPLFESGEFEGLTTSHKPVKPISMYLKP